jgi:hypothetical protein
MQEALAIGIRLSSPTGSVNHKPFHDLSQESSVRQFGTDYIINPFRLRESMPFVQEKKDVRMGETTFLIFDYENQCAARPEQSAFL